jgi:transcription elongation factor GreA
LKAPITKEGYETLKHQLEILIAEKRPRLLRALEEARAHGDISENADYEAAKEAYEFLQKKISELEGMLKNCEVIEIRQGRKERVEFGSLVRLKNLESEEVSEFRLVGPYESNVKEGRISVHSPLGRALLGKTRGEVVSFSAPSGEKCYEVIDVE